MYYFIIYIQCEMGTAGNGILKENTTELKSTLPFFSDQWDIFSSVTLK